MSEDHEESIFEEEEFLISLHTIPVEVFLHICTFLDGKEIIQTLKLVCKHFYEILSDDSVWRTWLKHRWPGLPTSNICYKDDVISSQSACLQIDRGLKLWSKSEKKIEKWVNDSAHISTVDAVKLLQGGRLGVSGSRDRSMAVWKTEGGLSLEQVLSAAHEGWIWALDSCPDTGMLYSCSWDSNVKMWALDQTLTRVAAYKCKAAALSVICRPHLVAAGLFAPSVELFDPRTQCAISSYRCHSRSVLALCFVRDFIVSISEDQTMSVWDVTAARPLKTGIHVNKTGHPLSLSFSDGNLLFVGDTESNLHIFDTLNDSFNLVESFNLGHEPRGTITSMWHNSGFVMTGSKDCTIRIHSTMRPPHLIRQLKSTNGGITSVDFEDPVLFAGCVNNAVEMWRPC